jgi:ornithine carbamoyltransferase
MKKDLVSITDLSEQEIESVINATRDLKAGRSGLDDPLKGKTTALVFQKPSNRTRVSFEVGMHQLGGLAIYLGPDDIALGKRESVKDVARTLSRYIDCIVARTFSHDHVKELAGYATVPVINGLSDREHPCQALGDIFTIYERFGRLKGINLVFIGDGNNVLNSLLLVCPLCGVNLFIATPKGYEPDKEILESARAQAQKSNTTISLTNNPKEIAAGTDVIYTDVWVSMGQEGEHKERLEDFKGFQINRDLAGLIKNKDYAVMHCLPAHRGEEISDDVLDGEHSIVFDQAENRMHVQKAILRHLLY